MTVTKSINISGGNLTVRGRTILSAVPDAVISTSAACSRPMDGIFLGVEFPITASRHVISLGTFRDMRFVASFRFKMWWMTQMMGNQGREIPVETQFLLVELISSGEETMYVVFLPIVEGAFRASLQGGPKDELELCLESGDIDINAAFFSAVVFVGAVASDPFSAISGGIGAVKARLKTFHKRAEKQLPGIVDYFGWCTWDAFYQDVSQDGVEAGLRSLTSAGTPPRFVIIDDGWQSVAADTEESKPQSLQRLIGFKENKKFQIEVDPAAGIKTIVRTAKERYGLKYVYVWHAITGYWGGVQPGVEGMEQFRSQMKYPKVSAGVMENDPSMKTDPLTVHGHGLVEPKSVHRFYRELHGYLAAAGVDGVKVDGQCILETLGAGLGGRVELTKMYHQALDESVARNFPDNGCIACMSQNNDALYCSKQTAIVRASDDFFPRDPMSHTIHIASVAYNSVFLGEFMLPDWDMFQSLHPAAEYHASARAISGGPVYISDAPGKHDFELLRKLVLPDGSILRAELPGRPTIDCLFSDPTRDGKSLLKIWNMNKFTGVIGVYNCQGAAWSSTEKKNMFHHAEPGALTCGVKASDIHSISDAATDPDWNGDCAIYRHRDGELVVLPHNVVIPVSLNILEHEILTISPIKVVARSFSFAPFGLVDMYNAGGAIVDLSYAERETDAAVVVCIGVKGCGRLGAYSSVKPRRCLLGSELVEFTYDQTSGFLSLQLENMPVVEKGVHKVMVEVLLRSVTDYYEAHKTLGITRNDIAETCD